MAGVTPLWQKCRQNMKIQNEYVKEGIAEFLGTVILCFFAVGASSQAFIESESGHPPSSVQPVLGGIFGLMTAILITGGISGAHINPAVSVGLAIVGELSWLKVPLYWICQIFGAYVGAGLAVAVYKAKADILGHGRPYSEFLPASIFSLVPTNSTVGTGMLDQIICVTILMMGILACIDKRNMKIPKYLLAFFICLIVGGITMCFGVNAGAVLNPARDLGPRLMAITIGLDVDQVMKCPNNQDYELDGGATRSEHWWLVGIFGPFIGASLGAIMYLLLIGAHLNDDEETIQVPSNDNAGGQDWRTTHFIPKAQAPFPPPPPQQQIMPMQPNYNTGNYGNNNNNSNNNNYNNNNNGGGINNNGYRDDMRNRQGY